MQKDIFFGMLLSSLAAPLLANILANNSKIPRLGVIKADEETIRADHDFFAASSFN